METAVSIHGFPWITGAADVKDLEPSPSILARHYTRVPMHLRPPCDHWPWGDSGNLCLCARIASSRFRDAFSVILWFYASAELVAPGALGRAWTAMESLDNPLPLV